jgi:GDP-4-dehydro-6-deoxy-D-mannose reductase
MKKENEIIVITGSNGYSAWYLSKYIKEVNIDTRCIGIDVHPASLNHYIDNYYSLKDFNLFRKALTSIDHPIKFFHLAGLLGNHSLPDLIEANVLWTARYLELLNELRKPDCFINIGSSAEYGKQNTQLLGEDLIPNPVNTYGLSKLMQAQLVFHFGSLIKFYIISTRTFNLIGPGLTRNLVVGKLIGEFLEVYNGKKEKIEIGRLDSIRDFIDVRDAVKYYYSLSITKPNYHYINVASGNSYSINDILKIISKKIGIDPKIQQNLNSGLKKGDVDITNAEISRLKLCFPDFICKNISETISEMIEYERKK